MALIRFDNVTVERQGKQLLHGIDWQVDPGQHWVVIGPNGAGKSTLLRVISGDLFASAGLVQVLGERYGQTDLRDMRRRLGWIAARLESRLLGRQTALQLVVAGGRGHYMLFDPPRNGERERAIELLAEAGAGAVAERRFELLSSGERQRVLLARARMAAPELLILDEPCAGLDLAGRELLLGALNRAVQDGTSPATLLITHHVEEIFPGITHALLLRGGEVVCAGRLKDILTAPNLSRTFGMSIELQANQGRYSARCTQA
jgi:iron complex transport system ATP-binding protein